MRCLPAGGAKANLMLNTHRPRPPPSCVRRAEGCRPRNNTASAVEVCQPLRWRLPATELALYSCPNYPLALAHERPVAALVAPPPTAAPVSGPLA